MKGLLGGFASAAISGGLTVGVVTSIRLPRFDLDALSMLGLLVAIAPLLVVGVALHEGGHLLAGALVRFNPCLFVVGPVKLERQGNRWRWGVNRVISKFGGLAAGLPQGAHRLRQRMLVLIAGGPMGSLLGGLAAWALLYSMAAPGARVTLTGADAAAYLLLLIFCLLSFGIGIVSLVPARSQGYSSDGAQLLRFMHSSPEVEAEVALVAVSTASIAGRRPRDWDETIMRRALALPANSDRGPLARLLAHVRALDFGDIEAARCFLTEALEHLDNVTQLGRPAILLHAAQFAALHDRDATAARRWLDGVGDGALIGAHSRWFAEAAVLHAEGGDGVDERLAASEAALDQALDRGGAVMLEDEIHALRAERSRATPASSRRSASDRAATRWPP